MGEWIDNEEIVKTFLKSYMTFLIQKKRMEIIKTMLSVAIETGDNTLEKKDIFLLMLH